MRLWTSATADARVAGGTPVGHLVASLAWHDADGTNDTPLVDDLAELTALTVVGPETVDGETLMHVRPGPGVKVDQQGWGPRDPSVTDYEIELDLWIQADGTLVKLVQTEQWKVPSGSSTAAVTATATETPVTPTSPESRS